MARKSAMDLMDEEYVPPVPQSMPDAPVNTVVRAQTPTTGHKLEIASRVTNRHIVDAMQLSYVMTEVYRSKFVEGLKDQMLRMSISKEGLGRGELIETLRAGGSLPESYYEGPQTAPTEWTEDQ